MADHETGPDIPAPAVLRLTEGEIQAVPGKPAGVMCHQDPRRQMDLDEVLGANDD